VNAIKKMMLEGEKDFPPFKRAAEKTLSWALKKKNWAAPHKKKSTLPEREGDLFSTARGKGEKKKVYPRLVSERKTAQLATEKQASRKKRSPCRNKKRKKKGQYRAYVWRKKKSPRAR